MKPTIVKLIEVRVRQGRLTEFLASQAIWNRETSHAPGYLGQWCGCDPECPELVTLMFWWKTRDDLDRWMGSDHDRIASMAGAAEFYESTKSRIVAAIASMPPCFPVTGD